MTEVEKSIVAKLQIIKEMATEKSVQQLADVVIEYVKSASKSTVGFKND